MSPLSRDASAGRNAEGVRAGATLWTRSTSVESADSPKTGGIMRCAALAQQAPPRARLARPGLIGPHWPVMEVMTGGSWDTFDLVTQV